MFVFSRRDAFPVFSRFFTYVCIEPKSAQGIERAKLANEPLFEWLLIELTPSLLTSLGIIEAALWMRNSMNCIDFIVFFYFVLFLGKGTRLCMFSTMDFSKKHVRWDGFWAFSQPRVTVQQIQVAAIEFYQNSSAHMFDFRADSCILFAKLTHPFFGHLRKYEGV